MAVLKYKTRGMVNPQGKQKVYFCCHPDDFARYFDKISDEILNKQNCALWYLESFETEYDEQFFEDLKGMQLFVVPVTTKFLCTENHALSIEFNFAIENHIPILPLMQEGGLEDIFNQKCGDLQFLDKNNTDATAISYDEKLEKYLSAVLIGDEMAEKIREAFDAYVFLSYRKKDRKYAQELMRLIHKNDFCRDIAIWYDEFLTPGENFNDSIKEALQKSGLFVLTVTPNLVNEINYIMTTEYPMAKDEGKPILPAELVPTNRDALTEKFKGIPNPTDAHRETELSQALLDAVKKIAIKENDNSPEHNFFIGLAYLNGVDVEVDHERAVSLITSSAEAGLVEAMSKLVEMYRSGVGVTRSYETAIEWQEKKIEYYQKIYDENPDEYNLNKLFWSIIKCGDYYKELGKWVKAEEKYSQANNSIESASLNIKSNKTLRNKSASYSRLGNIYNSEGNLEKAREYYEKSLEIFITLAEETNTVEARRDLSVSYNNLGNIHYSEGNLEKAREYYEKDLEISITLAEETNTVEARRDLSVSYNKLGNIYNSEGNLEKAREYYEKSLEIFIILAEETNTVEARRDLSVGYNKLGDIYKAKGNLEKAREYYEKDLEISITLAEETNTVEARRDLSVSYNKLGNIYNSESNLEKAREYYEKSLEIRIILAEETNTVEARNDLAVSYFKMSKTSKKKKLKYLKKAIESYVMLFKYLYKANSENF